MHACTYYAHKYIYISIYELIVCHKVKLACYKKKKRNQKKNNPKMQLPTQIFQFFVDVIWVDIFFATIFSFFALLPLSIVHVSVCHRHFVKKILISKHQPPPGTPPQAFSVCVAFLLFLF